MNRAHRRFLELAAASLDFKLSPSEREELRAHLATCDSCPGALEGMRADARAIRGLPTRELTRDRESVVLRRALGRGPDLQSLRLVVLAAALALLLVGLVVVGSDLVRPPETPVLPRPSDPRASVTATVWREAGPLQVARSRHTAGVLAGGQVVVAGGSNPTSLGSSEILDPAGGAWSLVAMQTSRVGHAGVILPDGALFLTGGSNAADVTLASTESFEATQPGWFPGPNLLAPRSSHAAVITPDWDVIVIGGFAADGATLASVEVYSIPEAQGFVSAAPLTQPRGLHTATVLGDGSVLVVGGVGAGAELLASCELFDRETEQWREVDAMTAPRVEHTATLLPDGRVLVTGGYQSDGVIASAEIFDPVTERWTAAATMAEALAGHAALGLNDRVLVVGGEGPLDTVSTSHWYDPAIDQWFPGPQLLHPRSYFTMVVLADGSVMAIGGQWTGASGIPDVEVLAGRFRAT